MQNKACLKLLLILLGTTIVSYSSGSYAVIERHLTRLENNLYAFYSAEELKAEEAKELDAYLRANRIVQLITAGGTGIVNRRMLLPAIINALTARGNRVLTELTLRTGGQERFGTAEIQALANALRVNRSLTTLNLRGNELRDAGIQALANALRENRTLTTLNLRNNRFGCVGVQALADALQANQTLTTLGLEDNNLGVAGAQALAAALRDNRALTTLSLRFNNLDAAGTQALADALRENRTLTTLDLAYNNLGAAGVQALAHALQENRTLIRLDIMRPDFANIGVQDLDLPITRQDIEEAASIHITGGQAIALALAYHNFTLREMNFDVVDVDGRISNLIRFALERNRLIAQLAPTVAARRADFLASILGRERRDEANNTLTQLAPDVVEEIVDFYPFAEDNNMRARRLMHDTLMGLTEQEQLLINELRARQRDIINILQRMGHPLPDPAFIPEALPGSTWFNFLSFPSCTLI